MSIVLADIQDKAKALLEKSSPITLRRTQTYDSTKNTIIVAGLTLEGVVNSVLNSDVITKQMTGIDYYYTVVYDSIEQRTLTVSLLPTSRSLNLLRDLALQQQISKGWFNLSVHENDAIINVYRAWIISLPEIGMEYEAANRDIVFGVKSMYSGIHSIDQPTEFEQNNFGTYGNRAQNYNFPDKSVIDENTGLVITPIKDAE